MARRVLAIAIFLLVEARAERGLPIGDEVVS